MSFWHRLIVAIFSLVVASATAQTPPPIPALPDTVRLTSYNITSSTCACSVGFQIYGDGTDVDAWVQVFVNGVQYLSTDPVFGWTLTSPTGSLGAIPRPITDAVLSFYSPQTGTISIIGTRRPRRASQFPENRGVSAHDLNQTITDIVAENREMFDKFSGVLRGQPGESLTAMPGAGSRSGNVLGFNNSGQPIMLAPGSGTGGSSVTGPGSSVVNHRVCWNNASGSVLKDCGPFPVYDVTFYGAVGDCVTDDRAAIQAAMDAVFAAKNSLGAVFFPSPPGGCYLTSTLKWRGVSLIGVPAGQSVVEDSGGVGVFEFPVAIQGKPGQDIFNVQDPNIGGAWMPKNSYKIMDLDLVVDDTVDVSATVGANRFPGRTVFDGAITNGSTALTSTQAEFQPGDVGQAITVAGAGAAGATLTTTISAVSTNYYDNAVGCCTTVTLAAAASTTVTNAKVYISIAGASATDTAGNCALGWDNKDGNTANWVIGGNTDPGNVYAIWENVAIRNSTNGNAQNHSCGIFLQGQFGQPYGVTWERLKINHLVYGFVEGIPTINSTSSPVGGDFNYWKHAKIIATRPFIYYNGGFGRIEDVHFVNGTGPQIIAAKSATENFPFQWVLSNAEYEVGNNVGTRLSGTGHHARSWTLSNPNPGTAGIWDARYSSCESCQQLGGLQVNGNLNKIDINVSSDATGLVNTGRDNEIIGRGLASSTSPSRPTALIPLRVGGPVQGRSNDFAMRGLASATYNNPYDLWLWGQDFNWTGNLFPTVADNASESGYYTKIIGNQSNTSYLLTANANRQFNQPGQILIGTNVPATKATVYAKYKCPVIVTTEWEIHVNVIGGGNLVTWTASPACSTSYAISAIDIDLTTYGGNVNGLYFSFNPAASNEMDLAWVAIRPWNGDEVVAPRAFANLPACNALAEGRMIPVNNSNTAAWGATISGTGANHVLAYCDGSNWTVAAM